MKVDSLDKKLIHPQNHVFNLGIVKGWRQFSLSSPCSQISYTSPLPYSIPNKDGNCSKPICHNKWWCKSLQTLTKAFPQRRIIRLRVTRDHEVIMFTILGWETPCTKDHMSFDNIPHHFHEENLIHMMRSLKT